MPIQFTCPHCGLRTQVSDQYAGQSGPCAGCGQVVAVPPLSEAFTYAPPKKSNSGPVIVGIALVLFVLMLLACGGLFFSMWRSAVPAARDAARRTQCKNNLRQIGLAMLSYHDDYKCYPPAYLADEDGQPMHSWRVLILPYLEEEALYDQYDFDQPWDSPENLALAPLMPQVYSCPSDMLGTGSETSYTMVVGPDTISDGTKATKISGITDGASNTILVVESANSGINWLDPRDLEAGQISFIINDPIDGGIVSDHPDGANVLFCDGTVTLVPGSVDAADVKAMCSIAGGEEVDDYWQFGGDSDW